MYYNLFLYNYLNVFTMKIDKITGNVPNCISCQIAHDITI